jgi:hypothetical protein
MHEYKLNAKKKAAKEHGALKSRVFLGGPINQARDG